MANKFPPLARDDNEDTHQPGKLEEDHQDEHENMILSKGPKSPSKRT